MLDKIVSWVLNTNRSQIIDSEELTVLELTGKTANKTNDCVDAINNLDATNTTAHTTLETIHDLTTNRHLDTSGNFTGAWFGITNPVLSDPGIAGVVASHTDFLEQITYNVKHFGAKGDGVTDDTASIQNVIDRVFNENGGTVFLPKGTYIVTQPLIYRNLVNIKGSGHRGATILKQTGTGAVIKFDSTYNTYYHAGEISGIEIVGNDTDTATGDGIQAKSLFGVNNIIFKDLWFRHIGRDAFHFEMDVNSAVYAWFQYCSFINITVGGDNLINSNCKGYAFYSSGGFSTNKFTNFRTYNVKKGVFITSYNHPTYGIISPECVSFDSCNFQNINPLASVTSDNTVPNMVIHGVTLYGVLGAIFTNCYFESVSMGDSTHASSALYVDGNSQNVLIQGGLFSAFYNGVYLQYGNNCRIEGVLFIWGGTYPSIAPTCIYMGSAYVVFSLYVGANSIQSNGTPVYVNDNGRAIGLTDFVGSFKMTKLTGTTVISTGATTVGGKLTVTNNSYSNPLQVGNIFIWLDSFLRLRFSTTAPTVDTDGFPLHVAVSGATGTRPTAGMYIGMFYWDTTLNKATYYKGGGLWSDSQGTTV